MLTRRQTLAALAAGLLGAAGCGDSGRRSITAAQTPGGGTPLGFNVHPLGGRFDGLQLEALRRLRLPWIRVTLGLVTDPDAARPYVASVPNVLGLVADYRLGAIDPAQWPDLVEMTLRRYPQVRRAELLNEPDRLNGLSPDRYVREFLRPGYERIRERFPGVAVVAAAPTGDRRRGPDQFRRMTDAGADDVCDYRAVHVFYENQSALSAIASSTGRPILVTETGTNVPSRHVRWFTEVIPTIRAALAAEHVFWYVLLESAALAAGGPVSYSYQASSVIDSAPNSAGEPQAAPGSGLYPLLLAGAA